MGDVGNAIGTGVGLLFGVTALSVLNREVNRENRERKYCRCGGEFLKGIKDWQCNRCSRKLVFREEDTFGGWF